MTKEEIAQTGFTVKQMADTFRYVWNALPTVALVMKNIKESLKEEKNELTKEKSLPR